MNLNAVIDLYKHMEWADAKVWRALMSCEPARDDPKLKELLYHLHLVQYAYLRAWRDEPRDSPYPKFDDLLSLMAWGRDYHAKVSNYLNSVADGQVSKTFDIPWVKLLTKQLGQTPAPSTLGEMMLQVVLHSIYHRGQINVRLRVAGGEPPMVDYIVWVWLGRPTAEWSSDGALEG